MMKNKRTAMSVICSIFLILLAFATVSNGAESTADVSVSAEAKEELRKKILSRSGDVISEREYVVGFRDILHVSVYGEGSMSASAGIQPEAIANAAGAPSQGSGSLRGRGLGIEVRMDGRISLRHIGDISVIGMTLTQIADYLKQLYSSIYENPSLTVTLIQSNSLQYTVMGQVNTPGLYHLDYPLTIVQAVARAGGFTEWANSEITVIRQDLKAGKVEKSSKQGKKFKFDFDNFLKGTVKGNISIVSGDVIVVH